MSLIKLTKSGVTIPRRPYLTRSSRFSEIVSGKVSIPLTPDFNWDNNSKFRGKLKAL
jgi:hypothetical protein